MANSNVQIPILAILTVRRSYKVTVLFSRIFDENQDLLGEKYMVPLRARVSALRFAVLKFFKVCWGQRFFLILTKNIERHMGYVVA